MGHSRPVTGLLYLTTMNYSKLELICLMTVILTKPFQYFNHPESNSLFWAHLRDVLSDFSFSVNRLLLHTKLPSKVVRRLPPFRDVRLPVSNSGQVPTVLTDFMSFFSLCFVDRASRYNCVKKINFTHNLFLVYFVNLYMFRAYLGTSSGGTTVCIQQLVLITLFRGLSVVQVGLELI